MATPTSNVPRPSSRRGSFLILLLVLGGALAVLCHEAFLPHRVHWANDMPLGAMLDSSDRLPGTFAGHWGNLFWIGGPTPSSSPAFSTLLQTIFPPEIYLKIFLPFSMFLLGFAAWLFFRQSGFAPAVCVIGGLGAGLNMHYFSNGSWGLGTWAVAAAMILIALSVIMSPSIRPLWVKAALAGLAIGMVVMEAFDTGAIMSLYAGIFIVFYFLTTSSSPVRGIAKTIGLGTVVVLFALLISGSTLFTLVGTQIKGTSNLGDTPGEKKAHWDFTTQWSFPKLETIRLFTPGVLGYRLQDYITDTNRASAYWGRIAEDPHVDELESGDPKIRMASAASLGLPAEVQTIFAGNDLTARDKITDEIKGQMQRRHTGSGDYTGVLVCLLALFALFNSWRKTNSPYVQPERNAVWFWGVAALVSLMAAWGRYGGIYGLIYHLPFLSNIRSPIKFLHPLNLCLIILSGYGLEALHRRYLRLAIPREGALMTHIKRWWGKTAGFDKKWAVGTLIAVGAALLGLLIYSTSKDDLSHYLQRNGFGADIAPQMAAFSIMEFLWFVIFFSASVGVIIAIMSGGWSGTRARFAWICLGVIMVLDLGRSDLPWVRYFDYEQKYSMNPVVDFLRHDPWEHRVMSRFLPNRNYIPGEQPLGALCHWWLENDYMAHDIESLEIDQAPRLPQLDSSYIENFVPQSQTDLSPPVRLWRLTNTRYILADARVTQALNQMADPKNSFRDVMRMNIVLKPGVTRLEDAGDLTVQSNENGAVSLIEFTQALPRAKLYANWESDDNATTLKKLNSEAFDPTKTVLIGQDTPLAQSPGLTTADAGTVTITSYKPRTVKLTADAKIPAVLLLNDRTGEFWNVVVDAKPAPLLRCNYIMRGVYLPAGHHEIEFRFQPPLQWLYVSVSAFAAGILLAGYVAFTHGGRPPAPLPETADPVRRTV